MAKLTVRLTLDEESLGSWPTNEDIFREYIGSKAPDAPTVEDEVATLGVDAVEQKGITVFPKNEDGVPCLRAYQFRGFLKSAFAALAKAGKAGYEGGKVCSGIKAYKKVVDQHIFVKPKMIPWQFPDGGMGYCVRPLRADGPTGSRTALAKSETVPMGSTAEFTVIALDKSLIPAIKEALEYGQYSGLGQWRSSGKGTFTYEILSEE